MHACILFCFGGFLFVFAMFWMGFFMGEGVVTKFRFLIIKSLSSTYFGYKEILRIKILVFF